MNFWNFSKIAVFVMSFEADRCKSLQISIVGQMPIVFAVCMEFAHTILSATPQCKML